MAIQLDNFLILSVVIFIYASDVAFGEFSYNLNVFRSAVYGLRMKRLEFYVSKAYSVILRELLLCQGVGEQKKNKIPHGQ